MDTVKFLEIISSIDNSKIVLLRKEEVVRWIFDDLSFLPEIVKINKTNDSAKYKLLEDAWGRSVMKQIRPDLKLDKQWTNLFGEQIVKEIYILLGHEISKTVKMFNYLPDIMTDDAVLEVKTGTYHTSGTASEKILGCPFKYAEIPRLYGKPLKIICVGGAEKLCRENYGNLPGEKLSQEKQEFIDFFKSKKIEYLGASDLLRMIVNKYQH